MLIGHEKQWEFLKRKFELDQLSHAYLFTGLDNIGKKFFAKELAKLVNCASLEKEKKPCQKCVNCQMIEKNSFPDFMIVGPEEGGEIQIAKIKQIQNFLSYKSYYGSFKTVVVDGAENMNQEAQNNFLKTLEEPKGRTLLILITSKPDMLLPTIFSRCQTLKFFKPNKLAENTDKTEKEKNVLKEVLNVMNLDFADKFKYVKALDFEKQKLSDILEGVQRYFRYLLFIETGVGKLKGQESFFDEMPVLKKYSVGQIKNIINLTEDISSKMLFTNANPKLALEILLMET